MRRRLLAAAVVLLALPVNARAQVSPGPLAKPHSQLEGNSHCLDCHASRSEGMDARCLECHEAITSLRSRDRGLHARNTDTPCARCHPDHAGSNFELIAWKEGSPDRFDHLRAGWPLQGKHAQTKCRDCHQPKYRKDPSAQLAKKKSAAESWLGLDPACTSCHEDVHRGALGVECTRCHTPSDWKTTPGFDHATTAFPLVGKHVDTPCAKCHQPEGRPAPVYKPLPHAECSPCHADPHAGRLGLVCASCHNPASFRDVPKTSFDHTKTRYPLAGAHRTVACAKCHDPKTAWGAKPAFATCGTCHRDPHAGKATLAGAVVDCTSCHSVEGFRPGRLPAEKHAPDRFPLEGKHAAVACADCHKRDSGAQGKARLGAAAVEIRPARERCVTCHEDAHAGQLANRPDKGECASCHDVKGWKPSRFGTAEHRELALPLEGAHAKAKCAECHGPQRARLGPVPPGIQAGKARVALRGIERDCAQCHKDPHRFEKARPCSDCHDATKFAPARVGATEHARFAFPLAGAHRAVPCVACHKELGRERTATAELTFRDSRRECAECHADPHGGQFGAKPEVRCARCHGDDRFRPASRFDHERDASFHLGRGHAAVPCAKCHSSNPGPEGRPVVRYRGIPAKCQACHGAKAPIEGDPS